MTAEPERRTTREFIRLMRTEPELIPIWRGFLWSLALAVVGFVVTAIVRPDLFWPLAAALVVALCLAEASAITLANRWHR